MKKIIFILSVVFLSSCSGFSQLTNKFKAILFPVLDSLPPCPATGRIVCNYFGTLYQLDSLCNLTPFGGGNAAGLSLQVQFNLDGEFAGDTSFIYDPDSKYLWVPSVVATDLIASNGWLSYILADSADFASHISLGYRSTPKPHSNFRGQFWVNSEDERPRFTDDSGLYTFEMTLPHQAPADSGKTIETDGVKARWVNKTHNDSINTARLAKLDQPNLFRTGLDTVQSVIDGSGYTGYIPVNMPCLSQIIFVPFELDYNSILDSVIVNARRVDACIFQDINGSPDIYGPQFWCGNTPDLMSTTLFKLDFVSGNDTLEKGKYWMGLSGLLMDFGLGSSKAMLFDASVVDCDTVPFHKIYFRHKAYEIDAERINVNSYYLNGELLTFEQTDITNLLDRLQILKDSLAFYRKLSDHDSLSQLKERSYNSLTDKPTIPAGTVTSVTGTAPIATSGGAAPVISIAAASQTVPGSMSAADKTKLDGIAAGATANAGTVTGVSGTAPIASSGGAAPVISISAATQSAAGSMSATDKAKLDGISAGGGMTWPSVAGIPYYSGSGSWGTSIEDKSADWNESHGWGPHTGLYYVAGSTPWNTFNLGQFASTTSSQLASVLSDETGTGKALFQTDIADNVTFLHNKGVYFKDSGGTSQLGIGVMGYNPNINVGSGQLLAITANTLNAARFSATGQVLAYAGNDVFSTTSTGVDVPSGFSYQVGGIATVPIYEVSSEIPTSYIRTLQSSPITFINAPGVGKMIEVISCTVKWIAGSVAFTGVSSELYLGTNGNNPEITIPVNFTQTNLTLFLRGSIANPAYMLNNSPLTLFILGSDMSSGNGSLFVYISYRIITL